MSESQPGLITRLFCGLWNAINFSRRLLVNIVFVLLVIFVLGAIFRSTPQLEDKTALVLDPEGNIVEQFSTNPTERALAGLGGNAAQEVQLRDLIAVIKAAAQDSRIERIVLVPDQMSAGVSTMRELGQALDRFRKTGKDVVVVSEGMEQSQYYLAAHANEILLDPEGWVILEGFANYRSYYRDALDKLGIDVHLVRVGTYKSAAEPYILNQASDAAKEAALFWMGDVWNEFLGEIADLRKLDPAAIAADIANLDTLVPQFNGDLAKFAADRGLVDQLATRAKAREILIERGAADAGGETFRQVHWTDYLAMQNGQDLLSDAPLVGVVVAQGDIVPGEQAQGMVGAKTTAHLLHEARDNEQIHAVVLRVDSPGGDAYASEVIRREVEGLQQAGKPVVVSMGDVAASGGYWISMDASEIWAQPTTITGSIGIYGLFVTIPQTLEKLGIHVDGVGTTPIAGAFDIRRPLDPRVESVWASVTEKGYRNFIGKVATARGKTPEEIDAIAQGRVWSGAQAKQRGLVDKLGGLEDAIASAAARADIAGNYRTRYVERELSGWERIALSFSNSASVRTMTKWSGIDALLPNLPAVTELRSAVDLLNNLAGNRFGVVAHCFCGMGQR
ncbi:MAG: signal peptide peptidase SppA [Gammaproteobacteria bacterium]|nr:MAG: signal peptide peptidase SppA [Gammaproteobacteria bacterium]